MDVSVTLGIKGEDNNNDENNMGTGYNNNNVKKATLHSMLAALLDDPILADVPKKPTLSDVDTLISLELGSAMRISVLKLDHTSIDVAVMNSATVKDLKLAIKKKVNDMEQSTMGHRHISWKHVWANFCLSYHNEKLLNDNSALQDYGMRNNSQVQFVPYVLSRALESIQGGENTGSFMVSTKGLENQFLFMMSHPHSLICLHTWPEIPNV